MSEEEAHVLTYKLNSLQYQCGKAHPSLSKQECIYKVLDDKERLATGTNLISENEMMQFLRQLEV